MDHVEAYNDTVLRLSEAFGTIPSGEAVEGDWEEWLEEVPLEAQALRDGLSLSPVPFAKLGAQAPQQDGSKVREDFLNCLGKYLQLPKETPGEMREDAPAQSAPEPERVEAETDWGLLAPGC